MVLCVTIREKDSGKYKKVTNFNKIYPSMPDILINKYYLDEKEIIRVIEVRRVDRPMGYDERGRERVYKNYRTKFKQVFSGTISEFRIFTRELCEKTIWRKNNEVKTGEQTS